MRFKKRPPCVSVTQRTRFGSVLESYSRVQISGTGSYDTCLVAFRRPICSDLLDVSRQVAWSPLPISLHGCDKLIVIANSVQSV